MTPPNADGLRSPGAGSDRGVGELLLAALTGSALAPFVQAIATKTGEDVHRKISGLLTRRRRPGPVHEPGKAITLADPQKKIALELPAILTVEDAAQLATTHLPASPSGQWLLIRHEHTSRSWLVVPIPASPSRAIEINNADSPTDE